MERLVSGMLFLNVLGLSATPIREHAAQAGVRIIDFVDIGHPVLLRMWDRRQRGYRAMGIGSQTGARCLPPD